MRRVLVTLLVLSWVSVALASSITLTGAGGSGTLAPVGPYTVTSVQNSNAAPGSTTITANIVSGSPGGNTLIVFARSSSAVTVSSVTDSSSNTYTRLISLTPAPSVEIWYCLNPTAIASSGTVTVTWGASAASRFISVASVNAVLSVSPGAAASASNSTVTTGAAVPQGAVVVNLASDASGTKTVSSGFTSLQNVNSTISSYLNAGAAGTVSYTLGGTNTSPVNIIGAFK